MIIFSLFDNLMPTQKDYIQTIDNKDLLKRDLLSKYRKLLSDKNIGELDKLKDYSIIFYGEIDKGIITLNDKDKMNAISLISFIGVEEKENGSKSN